MIAGAVVLVAASNLLTLLRVVRLQRRLRRLEAQMRGDAAVYRSGRRQVNGNDGSLMQRAWASGSEVAP